MASLPALREQIEQQRAPVPGSAVSKGRGGSLAPIRERDEQIHSADLSKSKSRIMQGVGQAKNQAAGYSDNYQNHIKDHR